MRIGQLAEQTSTSTHTLRFYEKLGLIRSDRRTNGYRDYPEDTQIIVELVRSAQKLGFTLKEISAELDTGEVLTDPEKLRDVFRSKLRSIDQKIVDLQRMRQDIAAMMERTCPVLDKSSH